MPPATVDLRFLFGRKPEQAVNYLRSKQYRISAGWQDVLGEAHARAFTVANIARLDLLQDISVAVADALENGKTFRNFRNDLAPQLQKKGWNGREIVDAETGEVTKFPPHRLKTIYRTNLQTAYAAGREAAIEKNKKRRPFAQFLALLDARTRDEHASLHGLIFPVDDPFWESFTPPLDYNCRCNKRTFTQRQIDARKLTVSSSKNRLKTSRVALGTGKNRKTVSVPNYRPPFAEKPVFPHPSFAFNPGKKTFAPNLNNYQNTVAYHYTKSQIAGPDFPAWANSDRQDCFPAGVLPARLSQQLKTDAHSVVLTPQTFAGQSDLKLTDYSKIQELIDNSRQFSRGNRLAFSGGEFGLVVRKSRADLFVESLQKTDASFLQNLEKNWQEIK